MEDDSANPLSYLGISEVYLQAFEVVWRERLAGMAAAGPEVGLILHPLSQLLGISAELAMKGILVAWAMSPPLKHDLLALLSQIEDEGLRTDMDAALLDLELPKTLVAANPRASLAELLAFYRTARFHIEMLNRLYDRPFLARYPQSGGKYMPDLPALHAVVRVIQKRLAIEAATHGGQA